MHGLHSIFSLLFLCTLSANSANLQIHPPTEIGVQFLISGQVETGENSFYFDLRTSGFNHPGGWLDLVGYYDPAEIEIVEFILDTEFPGGVTAEMFGTDGGEIRIRLYANGPTTFPARLVGSGILTILVDVTHLEMDDSIESMGIELHEPHSSRRASNLRNNQAR